MVALFPQGFRYVEKEGQCCSQCQQVACVANFPFGSVTIEVSAPLLCMPSWIDFNAFRSSAIHFEAAKTFQRLEIICICKVYIRVYMTALFAVSILQTLLFRK